MNFPWDDNDLFSLRKNGWKECEWHLKVFCNDISKYDGKLLKKKVFESIESYHQRMIGWNLYILWYNIEKN